MTVTRSHWCFLKTHLLVRISNCYLTIKEENETSEHTVGEKEREKKKESTFPGGNKLMHKAVPQSRTCQLKAQQANHGIPSQPKRLVLVE